MVIGFQWIIFIGIALVSWLVQMNLQNKFKKYSKIPTGNGMTGRDVAIKMLQDNGIYDVQVTHTPGQLTDHYNPANKTVNLSEGVYDSNSIMAAAVAGSRVWTCGAACAGLCPLDTAQQAGTGRFVRFSVDDMVVACRYFAVRAFPSVVVCRHYLVCYDYVIQFYHPSGGDRCK